MNRWVDLVYELAKKNLRTRYSNFLSAVFWTFLFPFLTVGIFYVVFSIALKIKIEEAPFALYLMTSVLTWQFFHDSVMASVTSLVDNKHLLKEAKFPHYLVPLSIIFTNIAVYIPSLVVMLFVSLVTLKGLPVFIIFLPFVLLIHLGIIIGLSIIFSIVYVKRHNIKYIVEAVFSILFYLTPAFYSVYLIKNSFSPLLYSCYIHNPFAGILTLYRSAILKGFYGAVKEEVGFFPIVIVPFVFSLAVFLTGVYYYRKNKSIINDFLAY